MPDGYALVRVDSRGAGRSPGVIDVWSAREAQDYAICIDWAGQQPWSNGKVGLNGISYYVLVGIPVVRDALGLGWPPPGLVQGLGVLLILSTLLSIADRARARRTAP